MRRSARMMATSTGCTTNGSPLLRHWPACASLANRNAFASSASSASERYADVSRCSSAKRSSGVSARGTSFFASDANDFSATCGRPNRLSSTVCLLRGGLGRGVPAILRDRLLPLVLIVSSSFPLTLRAQPGRMGRETRSCPRLARIALHRPVPECVEYLALPQTFTVAHAVGQARLCSAPPSHGWSAPRRPAPYAVCVSMRPSSRNTATPHAAEAGLTGKASVLAAAASSASPSVKKGSALWRCSARSARYTCARQSWSGVMSRRMRSLMPASARPNSRWMPAGLPVAARAAAHLVELDLVERQVVQHHVADVGDVHPFAEGRCRHEHRQRVRAEQLFDALALRARKACVVEADERCQLRHPLAQSARHGHRLLARIHVDHRLAARCHEAWPGRSSRLRRLRWSSTWRFGRVSKGRTRKHRPAARA